MANASAASRNSYSASAASRNSSASSAFSIKTLYVINHLRDVERMLTLMSPEMATLKLTISYLENDPSSIRSFPDFLKSATNLMTSSFSPALAFKKLSNIKVLPALSTNIYFGFHFRFLLDSFSARAFILPKLSKNKE